MSTHLAMHCWALNAEQTAKVQTCPLWLCKETNTRKAGLVPLGMGCTKCTWDIVSVQIQSKHLDLKPKSTDGNSSSEANTQSVLCSIRVNMNRAWCLLGETQSAQKSFPSTFRISSVAPATVWSTKHRHRRVGVTGVTNGTHTCNFEPTLIC